MMSLYLWLDLLIIGFPLLFGFLPPVRYHKRLKAVLSSMLAVGIPFVIWDIVFTKTGVWAFNPDFIAGVKFLDLPIEELFFFVAVPYSCLFILECLDVFFKDRVLRINSRWLYAVAALALVYGMFFAGKIYTAVVVELFAVSIIVSERFSGWLFRSRNYWAYMLICFGLFFIFNFVLTSLPVVVYNAANISGVMVFAIPIEDFFYNYVLLAAYAAVFIRMKRLFSLQA